MNLAEAIVRCDFQLVKLMLHKGADPNTPDYEVCFSQLSFCNATRYYFFLTPCHLLLYSGPNVSSLHFCKDREMLALVAEYCNNEVSYLFY